MNIDKLLIELNLDAIAGIDFETYYDSDYSLKKMSTTEYIVDPRFKTQMASVQWHTDKKATVMNPTEFKAFCKDVDWKRTGMLAHHCQFDSLILSHHFGAKPAFYLDTLSMGRALMPVQVGGSLKALCKAFGREAKKLAGALQDVKGVKYMTMKQYKALAVYAGKDIEDTWFLFGKLLPYTSIDELRLIDITVKMYAQPTLLVDGVMAASVEEGEAEKKAKLLRKSKADKKQLMSNQQFATLLEAEGVEVPVKISKTTGEVTLALARNDLAFKDLLKHPSKKVRTLVEARLANKSTMLEKRAAKLASRSSIGAQPIYLNYWGARTGRWSGGDKANWQNLTRGSDLRKAVHAPARHTLVIADLSQIEARVLAWLAGQRDVLAAFAQGKDVYSLAAGRIYGREITKEHDPRERFVGKVATLALGYGAGAVRFADMLRLGQFGPPIEITSTLAADIVRAWRNANGMITGYWRSIESAARSAFFAHQTIKHGPVTFSGSADRGFVQLPGGTMLRYDGLEAAADCTREDGFDYISRWHMGKDGPSVTRTKLYGGLLVENITQAIARNVIAGHMLEISRRLPDARIAMSTHDEVVLVVLQRRARSSLAVAQKVMTMAPAWAPDLPLAVDAHISERYDK